MCHEITSKKVENTGIETNGKLGVGAGSRGNHWEQQRRKESEAEEWGLACACRGEPSTKCGVELLSMAHTMSLTCLITELCVCAALS